MTVSEDCTFLVGPNSTHQEFEIGELRRVLESGNENTRISAMKCAIGMLSSGQGNLGPTLLMTIIRFVLPNQKNKLLKKLVLLFIELVPKIDNEGKLLGEMILLCNAIRSDLQHPNEYVRGVTLRFLTRIREPEILEPLLPSIRSCLEHRHPFVRRNAIFALFSIYRSNDFLVPDAPEVVQQLLVTETDSSCQRGAFIMLSQTESERAEEYLSSLAGQLSSLDPLLQMAILDYLRTDSTRNEEKVSRNIKLVATLLESSSTVVKFEAATALMQLSLSPIAIRAVASCYIDLAMKETDNNAKLMVLDRFRSLQAAHAGIINENILDVLRVLGASDLEVKRKALEILLSGITARHAADLVNFLIKEFKGVQDYELAADYKACLLSAIDSCSYRFSSTSVVALECFVTALRDESDVVITDAIRYVKVILERQPTLRESTIQNLLGSLNSTISSPRAMANLLWILGEFCSGRIRVVFIFLNYLS